MNHNVNIIIAADGGSSELLRKEFPDLTHLYLHGYRIKFSKYLPVGIKLAIDIPRISLQIIKEHTHLAKLIKENDIDIVISDNRYGLWSKKAYSVFITHQPNIIPPSPLEFSAPLLRQVTRYIISKYNECWIPDMEEVDNLSGKLSHGFPLPSNVRFIGLLSRFDEASASQVVKTTTVSEALSEGAITASVINTGVTGKTNVTIVKAPLKQFEIVAIISGPEPHRGILEKKLIRELQEYPAKSLLIRGITGAGYREITIRNLTIVDHLTANELGTVLMTGPVVICRAGYSTLMDMEFTGNRLICIPTPGQTEQEYLALCGATRNRLVYAKQNNFSISECMKSVYKTSVPECSNNTPGYKQVITQLLKKIALNAHDNNTHC